MLSTMQLSFNPSTVIESALRQIAIGCEAFSEDFNPEVRAADPRFGDFQANGVLGFAKRNGKNPRYLAQQLLDAANESGQFLSLIHI